LPADGAFGPVIQSILHPKSAARPRSYFDPTFRVTNSRRFPHDKPLAKRTLLDDSSFCQRVDECLARSVAARQLRSIDPDLAIVNFQPGTGRQHMLDHFDRNTA
jgi:hypothetical protein